MFEFLSTYSDQLWLQNESDYKLYLTTTNAASSVNAFYWNVILLQCKKLGSLEKSRALDRNVAPIQKSTEASAWLCLGLKLH